MSNTKNWILTDDDAQQYVRPTDNEDIFDCIEMIGCGFCQYRVYFAVVDVESYLECNRAEIRSVLHSYGYGDNDEDDSSIEEVATTYPNASQIIAECLFESCSSLDSEDLFIGTDEECENFIKQWIKQH